jgi:hypothetical protein
MFRNRDDVSRAPAMRIQPEKTDSLYGPACQNAKNKNNPSSHARGASLNEDWESIHHYKKSFQPKKPGKVTF